MENSISINLLKRAQTPQFFKKKIRRTLNIMSGIFIIAVGLVSISFFLANYFLVLRLKDSSQEIKTNEMKISALSDVMLTQFAISDRVGTIEKVLSNQKPFDENLQDLQRLLPSEVFLSQVTLGETTFSISVSSLRLSSLNQFIENLISPELGGKTFAKIVLEGLSVDEKGSYRLNISGEIL